MRAADPAVALVRILDDDGKPVGCGVLLDSGEVLTVAHVLNVAAGDDPAARASRVGEKFTIDLPLSDHTGTLTATVRRWARPRDRKDDIATLTVDGTPPAGATLDPGVPLSRGSEVTVYGFPAGVPDGMWAVGHLIDRVRGSWWQIDQNEGGALSAGFSGSPVWCDGRLLGLVWGGREGHAQVLMIPAELLHDQRSVPQRDTGSGVWKLNHVVGRSLTALLNDLVGLELRGLRQEQCLVVQAALDRLSNELALLDDSMAWANAPHEVAEQLLTTYREWNGHEGPGGAAKRGQSLGELRSLRRALGARTTVYESSLYEERLSADADRMMDHFAALPRVKDDRGRTLFPHVRLALTQYGSRVRAATTRQAQR